MTEQYLQNRIRLGWGLLIGGVVVFAVGLALQLLFSVPFNARIISGLGIFIFGLGIAQMVRYRAARSDRKAAARIVNEERDERMQLIRGRAGHRAFWVSLAMTYIALMWLSFASSGSLPAPTPDGLWYYLAAAVVLPFLIYVASIVYDQNHG